MRSYLFDHDAHSPSGVDDETFEQRIIHTAMVGVACSMAYTAFSTNTQSSLLIAFGSVVVAAVILTSRSALSCFPTAFKVLSLAASVITTVEFASTSELSQYSELLSDGSSSLRAACLAGGIVIAAMPMTTLRWKLTLLAQWSVMKAMPSGVFAYRMSATTDDAFALAFSFYVDRTMPCLWASHARSPLRDPAHRRSEHAAGGSGAAHGRAGAGATRLHHKRAHLPTHAHRSSVAGSSRLLR